MSRWLSAGSAIRGDSACRRISGRAKLETASGDRSYDAGLAGIVEVRDEKLVRFDLVANGRFGGEGQYTRNAPNGKFTLGIAFTISKGGEASTVAPAGARDLRGYLAP